VNERLSTESGPDVEVNVVVDHGGRTKLTHQELAERLEGVGMTATASGGKGTKAALTT